ncbi:MAG: TetR/AcrR family transcriptional regulator [Parvibaculum sp.]
MIYAFAKIGDHSEAVARNRARKMREILNAALELACEGGLDNLTLHRLADRMGRSVAAVYRYFPSREAVVAELQRLIATHIRLITGDAQASLTVWADAQNLSAEERSVAAILTSCLAYEAFARHAPQEFGLVTRYLSVPENVLPDRDAARIFEVTSESLDLLGQMIDRAMQKGCLNEGKGRDRAVMLWAALQGSIDALKIVRRAGWSPASSLTRDMIENLIIGWGANRETLTPLAARLANENPVIIQREVRDLIAVSGAYQESDEET